MLNEIRLNPDRIVLLHQGRSVTGAELLCEIEQQRTFLGQQKQLVFL